MTTQISDQVKSLKQKCDDLAYHTSRLLDEIHSFSGTIGDREDSYHLYRAGVLDSLRDGKWYLFLQISNLIKGLVDTKNATITTRTLEDEHP